MAKRPFTDYHNTAIIEKFNRLKAKEFMKEAEKELIRNIKAFAMAVNKMVGRTALTDEDINLIVLHAKREANLL